MYGNIKKDSRTKKKKKNDWMNEEKTQWAAAATLVGHIEWWMSTLTVKNKLFEWHCSPHTHHTTNETKTKPKRKKCYKCR